MGKLKGQEMNVEERKEYHRKYYEKNRERMLAYKKNVKWANAYQHETEDFTDAETAKYIKFLESQVK